MRSIVTFIKTLISKWQEHHDNRLAASIAFYTMFSFAPLLIISMHFLGYVYGEEIAQQEIISQIENLTSINVANFVESIFAFSPEKWFTSALSIVILFFSSTAIFTEIRFAFNKIWGVEIESAKEQVLSIIRGKIIAIILVPGISLVFLATLFIDTAFRYMNTYFIDIFRWNLGTLQNLGDILSFVIICLIFWGLQKFLPSKKASWANTFMGSLVSTLLFEFGKNLISWYLYRGHITSFYGTAGSLIVTLIWVYYSAQIMLLGVEITKYLEEKQLNNAVH